MMVYPAFAAEFDQIVSTSNGTLDVGIFTIPEIPNTAEPTKLKISFLKPGTEKIQEHIDYRITVVIDACLDDEYKTAQQCHVFGPIRLTHTSPGHITIPVQFSENGLHQINIEVEGILFSPIPLETASLTMNIEEIPIPAWIKNNAEWWADDMIPDSAFVSGLQWLISNDIMSIPPTEQGEGSDNVIPGWIKNNAGWWASGEIPDSAFVSGLQWLISNGIMTVS